MDYKVICDGPPNRDPFDDPDAEVFFLIFPTGNKSYCFTHREINISFLENTHLYVVQLHPTENLTMDRPINVLPPNFDDMELPGSVQRTVRENKEQYTIDKTLETEMENGHTVFYAYPSYTTQIEDMNEDSPTTKTVYSVIPVKRELFLSSPLNQIRELLNEILPEPASEEEIASLMTKRDEFVKAHAATLERGQEEDDEHIQYFIHEEKEFEEKEEEDFTRQYNNVFINACRNGDINVARDKLAEGVNPGIHDNTALLTAVYNGHTNVVELLLSDPRVNPNVRDGKAIILAIEENRNDILQLLLKDPRIVLPEELIFIAVRSENKEPVKILLEDGRSDPSANDNDALRFTIRHMQFNDHQDIQFNLMKLLIKDPRVDPSVSNNALLLYSVRGKLMDLFKYLLKDSRIDPSKPRNKPLLLSCQLNLVNNVRLLLKDPRVDPGADSNRCLRIAIEEGNKKIVELLLKDPRVDPSLNDNIVIIEACTHWDLKTVKTLLKDPRVDPSVGNQLPLLTAVEEGQPEIVEELLKDPRVIPNNQAIVASLEIANRKSLGINEYTRVMGSFTAIVNKIRSMGHIKALYNYLRTYDDKEISKYAETIRGYVEREEEKNR